MHKARPFRLTLTKICNKNWNWYFKKSSSDTNIVKWYIYILYGIPANMSREGNFIFILLLFCPTWKIHLKKFVDPYLSNVRTNRPVSNVICNIIYYTNHHIQNNHNLITILCNFKGQMLICRNKTHQSIILGDMQNCLPSPNVSHVCIT